MSENGDNECVALRTLHDPEAVVSENGCKLICQEMERVLPAGCNG